MTWDRSAVIPVILERIAKGESLHGICADEGLPGLSTVMRWLDEDEPFREQYARAHVIQADWHHHHGHEIAAERPPMVGDTNHKAGDARMDSAFVAWQRLRWDAHRWSASKLNPKKYADVFKQQVTGADDGPLEAKISIEFVGAPAGSLPLPVGDQS